VKNTGTTPDVAADFALKVYAQGANPNTATPMYTVNESWDPKSIKVGNIAP
jgi:hypothetical protein